MQEEIREQFKKLKLADGSTMEQAMFAENMAICLDFLDTALQEQEDEIRGEFSPCPTCNCLTKKVCGKCKQDAIDTALEAQRVDIVGEIEEYEKTSPDWKSDNPLHDIKMLIKHPFQSYQ